MVCGISLITSHTNKYMPSQGDNKEKQHTKYSVKCIRLYKFFTGNILSFLLPLFSRRAVVSYWRKYMHEVLLNRLGGLSLPRKSVVRLTDRPDMTLDVYRGRKTTKQQQQ